MSRAKCKICGSQLDTTTAHLVVTYDKNGNAKKSYYCSQEEYQKEEQRKIKAAADKDRVYVAFCDILGVNGITNTAIWKEKSEINKVFPDEKIAEYLEENKTWIADAVSKLDGRIYGKIRYVSTILRNSLDDFKPKVREIEKPKVQVEETVYESVTPIRNNRRRSLANLEDEF